MTAQGIPTAASNLAVKVLLKSEPEGKTSASVLGFPVYRVVSHDRASALSQLQALLAEELQGGEVVTLDVQMPGEPHPWAEFAGMYQGSELFESVLQNIDAERQQLNDELARVGDS